MWKYSCICSDNADAPLLKYQPSTLRYQVERALTMSGGSERLSLKGIGSTCSFIMPSLVVILFLQSTAMTKLPFIKSSVQGMVDIFLTCRLLGMQRLGVVLPFLSTFIINEVLWEKFDTTCSSTRQWLIKLQSLRPTEGAAAQQSSVHVSLDHGSCGIAPFHNLHLSWRL